MTKADLRKSIKLKLKTEKETGKLDSEKESLRISNAIINSISFQEADYILAYMSLPDEVNISTVIKTALNQKKTLALPKCNTVTTTIDFFTIINPEQNKSGSYGISEPEAVLENKIDISKIDAKILFLIPGRAFTKDGLRLGRGKAFYDKYLAQIPEDKKNRVQLAGVCFPQQIVESIPTDEHDIKMNRVFY